MAKFKSQTETIVGLFIFGTVVLLLGVVLFMGKRQNILEKRYELYGVFNTVAGLETGAEVLLSGINVGHVKDITFGPDNRVKVVMSIAETQRERIRQDSMASIRTRGLMGDRYVAITTGSLKEPFIPDQGTIRTSDPSDVVTFLEETRPMLRDLEGLVKNMSMLTDQLTVSNGSVKTMLENLDAITADIRRGKGTAGALLKEDGLYRDARKLLQTTQETMENIKTVSKDARVASKSLPDLMAGAGASLQKLGDAIDGVSDAMVDISRLINDIQEVVAEAKPMATNLRSSSEQIKAFTPRIGRLLQSMTEGVTEARKVIEATERHWLIRGYLEATSPAEPIALSGRDLVLGSEK
jgi:phospholipid/cholesterol/gamma-HCH transport system substrate-binding protein